MKELKIEPITFRAYIIEDKHEGVFTVALEGKGGPIVSDPDYDTACEKFETALDLANAIQNLTNFKSAVKSADAAKLNKTKESKIQFIKLQAA